MKFNLLKIAVLTALAVAALPHAAMAVVGTYYWDPNITGGTAQGGTGTWNATNSNWAVLSTSSDTTWPSGQTAVFAGASAGTVTLGTGESASNIFFNTAGYTLTGSTLTVSGSMSVAPGGNAAINSTLSVPGDLDLVSGGSLTIGSKFTPSASGALNIGSGSLILAQTSSTAITFNNGGTINGDLVLAGSTRVNFGSLVGSTTAFSPSVATYNGTGAVQIQAPFTIVSSLSGSYGGAIGVGFQLNSLNLPFSKTDVTQSVLAYPSSGAFSVAMGATKNGNFNGYLAFNGPISGNSDVVFCTNSALTGGGAAVTLLNSQCSYTGTTFLDGNGPEAGAGGSLILGTSNAFPVSTDFVMGFLTPAPSHHPELDLNGNNTQIGSLSMSASANTAPNAASFFIANNNVGTLATLTVSGATTPANPYGGNIVDYDPVLTSGGTLALVKGGPNTLKLSGSNTYSGGTTLNGGTLILANSAGSALGGGNLTINGGTLESDPGSISGSIIAGSGLHTIAPGGLGSIGTLVVGGSVNLNSNSSLVLDIAGGSSDLLQIGGSLNISSPIDLDFNTSGTLAGPYTLATYASSPGLVPGDFDVSGLPANYALEVTSSQLSIAPVPEPSTLAMLFACAIGVLVCWRRRR